MKAVHGCKNTADVLMGQCQQWQQSSSTKCCCGRCDLLLWLNCLTPQSLLCYPHASPGKYTTDGNEDEHNYAKQMFFLSTRFSTSHSSKCCHVHCHCDSQESLELLVLAGIKPTKCCLPLWHINYGDWDESSTIFPSLNYKDMISKHCVWIDQYYPPPLQSCKPDRSVWVKNIVPRREQLV